MVLQGMQEFLLRDRGNDAVRTYDKDETVSFLDGSV
jgi:hypothetical protein